MWLIPILVVSLAVLLAVPLARFMAQVLDSSEARNRLERWVDTGPQTGVQYCLSMLLFNVLVFLFGFILLAIQPWIPEFLNPDGKKMLAPSTIFNTAASFLTNTNLQHYAGEVHLSYFSQLFVIMFKQFVTPAIGLAALLAMIRGFRGDKNLGNFYLDVFRCVFYLFLPMSFIVGVLLMLGGVPMTLAPAATVMTIDGAEQTISRGPVAAIVAIKQLGTNGGGFFGANSAHPFENPTAWTNIIECVCIILIPMACIWMFGRMVKDPRHARVIFGVNLVLYITLVVVAVTTDAGAPNPGLKEFNLDQSTGNLEGKELRFGPGAGPTWAASTTVTSNGSVNCMHDSLNPITGIVPLTGMWLNCIFGGVGVGLINLFVYLIIAVFLAGLMVGRTPEYLNRKVEAREMKLAMLALLIHPLMILAPAGIFAVKDWGTEALNNPAAHGLSEIVYEFSSASANNGSGFEGLGDTHGFYVPDEPQDEKSPFIDPEKNPVKPAPQSIPWDIATGLVMLISRFVPIFAPILLAASLAKKKSVPMTSGTLRTDNVTFGFMLLGTILLVGALEFLPVAALGPIAEQLGPIPFK